MNTKERIITVAISLMMMTHSLLAQSYITIHYNNGQKSERFYEMDIDSIVYSKIGIDSLVYNDWIVKEIWERDSVYRIPLSVIDSVSFCNLDTKEMANTFSAMAAAVEPLYMQCETISQIEAYLPTIRDIEGVEDAWVDATTLFITMKDGGTMVYYYPIDEAEEYDENAVQTNVSLTSSRLFLSGTKEQDEHDYINAKKICIAYQQHNDEGRRGRMNKLISLYYDFINCGYDESSVYLLGPSLSFYNNSIFDYDFVFLNTHGHYNNNEKTHWLATDEELYVSNYTEVSDAERKKRWQQVFKKKYNNKYSDDHVYVGAIKEKRNDKEYIVYYTTVSEKFIASSKKEFKNKTIIFNTSCKSLYGEENEKIPHYNASLARTFLSKGASNYFGYTDTDHVGCSAGISFCKGMLNGASVEKAHENIESEYHEEDFYNKDNHCTPELVRVYSKDKNGTVCIIHPETGEFEDMSTDTSVFVKLHGNMKKLNPESLDGFEFGFCLSKPDDEYEIMYKADVEPGEYSVSFSLKIDNEEIELGTTYNYRSYFYDGANYCYGEEKNLKIETLYVNPCPDNNHPHAIDLGLPSGTKWACCNVGAKLPEQYGGYYAWGETRTKDSYGDLYQYDHFDPETFKYKDIGSDIAGTSYDVAHVKWGSKWKMPSIEQYRELANYSKARITRLHGVFVVEILGNNGSKIFLPFAGFYTSYKYHDKIMRYWSSTLNKTNSEWAEMLNYGNGMNYPSYIDYYVDTTHLFNLDLCGQSRYEGLSVRPVWE